MCLQLLRDAVSVNSETQSESCLVSGCNVGSTWTAPYMLFKSGITYLWFPKCFLAYCYTIFLKIITKMEETKIQWKTSAPVVPVRAHLFTSHESLPSSHHMNTHLHSHPSSACGSASKHLPNGVCCLHFTASLIDLASSVSWRDLHLGQPNLNPSLGCRLKVSNSSDAPFDYFLSPRIWKQGGKIKLLFPPFLLYVLKTLTVHLPFSLRLAVKQKEVKWIKTSKSKAWYQVTHKPW